jgi:hypothetical protein
VSCGAEFRGVHPCRLSASCAGEGSSAVWRRGFRAPRSRASSQRTLAARRAQKSPLGTSCRACLRSPRAPLP